MNRQQRRLQAKKMVEQYDFRQEKRKFQEEAVRMYCICIGLAVYDVYGNMPTRIGKLAMAFSKRIRWANDRNLKVADIERELYNLTGIEYQWEDDI